MTAVAELGALSAAVLRVTRGMSCVPCDMPLSWPLARPARSRPLRSVKRDLPEWYKKEVQRYLY
jgi:hypothetical protein